MIPAPLRNQKILSIDMRVAGRAIAEFQRRCKLWCVFRLDANRSKLLAAQAVEKSTRRATGEVIHCSCPALRSLNGLSFALIVDLQLMRKR